MRQMRHSSGIKWQNLQMKNFYETTGGKWIVPDGYEKLFHVIDGIINVYSGGNQSDMNCAAWHSVYANRLWVDQSLQAVG